MLPGGACPKEEIRCQRHSAGALTRCHWEQRAVASDPIEDGATIAAWTATANLSLFSAALRPARRFGCLLVALRRPLACLPCRREG